MTLDATILAMLCGMGLAGALLAMSGQREPEKIAAQGRRDDLEARRTHAVQGLRDLELEKEKLDPQEYARQRQALLSTGANALRELDQKGSAPAAPGDPMADAVLSPQALAILEFERQRLGDEKYRVAMARAAGLEAGAGPAVAAVPVSPAPAPVKTGLSPQWQGALTVIAIAVMVIGLLYLAQMFSADRGNGSMTGGFGSQGPGATPSGAMGGSPPPVPMTDERAAMEQRLEANPNDIEALNALTLIAIQDDPGSAMQFNDRALVVDPKNVDARINRALLRTRMGMPDKALILLDEVIADVPDEPLPHLYKGLVAEQSGDGATAVTEYELALAKGATDAPFVQERLASARAMRDGTAPPPGGPPSAPTSGGPAGGGEVLVSGTVTLDPTAGDAVGAFVYVFVKDPAGGPPLAAKKLPAGPFPMDFQITTGDRIPMAGDRPIPAVILFGARLDADGDPMTGSDVDPGAKFPNLAAGTQALEVVLK